MRPHQLPPIVPFGSWPSPLEAATLAASGLRLASPRFAADGSMLWVEGRPTEGGRSVVVRQAPGRTEPVDLTPAPYDVRSRVHEYGGGAYAALGDTVVFTDNKSGALYRVRFDQEPQLLTAPGPKWRFGDLTADPGRERILAVAEHDQGGGPPDNLLVAIDLATGAMVLLAAGADFYASPTPSHDGSQLAWVSWMHPHMPWDAGTITVAALDPAGVPCVAHQIAGTPQASAQQPAFAEDGALWFLLESPGMQSRDLRWRLHRYQGQAVTALATPSLDAELGVPPWQLGVRTWGFLDATTAIASGIAEGQTSLHRIDLVSGRATSVPTPFVAISDLAVREQEATVHAGLSDRPSGIFALYLGADAPTAPRQLRSSMTLTLEEPFVSMAEALTFPTTKGDEAHGFFYAPQNPRVGQPEDAKPPLIVMVHGGPTACATPAFNPLVQFWTTRGLAVLDVNYRGSTGFGRWYRDRLRRHWGVFDVDDCMAGARALVAAGRVDPTRLAIRGSSAGGFTALAALTATDCVFHAGASIYGVSDLAALAADTHKFESRYLETLVGAWPGEAEVYVERSPITQANRVRCPIVFFQGLDDKVVPPDQTARFAERLREEGLPVEVHTFAGEQHGFRRAETLRTVYVAELNFYGRVFGFSPV
jgi:dipeptidyl aminopeptidase/acylaminoacyl peptidase